jgi:YVTN family beta-propeller protein
MKKLLLINSLAALLLLTPAANAADLAGMPKVLDSKNIYAADTPNNFSDAVKGDAALIYVPNTLSNTVQIYDQKTYKLVRRVKVGKEPQHVVPAYDLKTLYANSDKGNSLTPFDAKTGKPKPKINLLDPYNLYFTPNGKYAVVMQERMKQIAFADPHTFKIIKTLKTNCAGVNHADWTADGNYFVASCEFSGTIIEVDTAKMKIVHSQFIPDSKAKHSSSHHDGLPNLGPQPQDVKISPDGKTFYIADMMSDGIWAMSAPWGKLTYIQTGFGAHGLYVTRDAKNLVITNRDESSISILDFSTNKIIHKYKIPGNASPDMGGITADGKAFWVSGRYDNAIYEISLNDGHLIKKIKTDKGPHGLAVWPQPGRYSLGHTGIMR